MAVARAIAASDLEQLLIRYHTVSSLLYTLEHLPPTPAVLYHRRYLSQVRERLRHHLALLQAPVSARRRGRPNRTA